MSQPTAKQFLMGGGGNAAPYVKFANIGDGAGGYIVAEPYTRPQNVYNKPGEIEKWPNGDIMHQLLIPLLTEVRDPTVENDDGERTLIVNGNARGMKEALKAAVQAAQAEEVEAGGYLSIWRSGGSGASGDPYQFQAQYQPPTPQGLSIVTQHQAQKEAQQPQQATPQQQFFGPGQQPQPAQGFNTQATAPPPQQFAPPSWPRPSAAMPQQFAPPAQPSQPVTPPQQATATAAPQYDEATKAAIRASMTPDQAKAAGMDVKAIWPDYQG